MALTKNIELRRRLGDFDDIPVAAATRIFQGAFVGVNAGGFAKNLAVGDIYVAGVAEEEADNTTGANGAIRVKVRRDQQFRILAVTGVTGVADVGDLVYATAEDTFTKTRLAGKYVGRITEWVTGTTCVVEVAPRARVCAHVADGSAVNDVLAALRAAGLMEETA